MSIRVEGLTKRFGDFVALDRIDLEARTGELLALLGPSGSGKTTLLRVIAGLETPDTGTVRYHDEDVTNQDARERNFGFVFQHYALFRHLDVFENVAFGLRVRRAPRAEVRRRVGELLELVGLAGLEKRYPTQISGGQRQRVALARALAARPKVLLLDEPFGALDAKVRRELRAWLRRLHDEIHVTSVFVTHDQEEAFEVADRVVVMNHGKIEQVGTPREVSEQPATPFVMDFIGNANIFVGRVQNGHAYFGTASIPSPEHSDPRPRIATVYVRPHELEVERTPRGESSLRAKVARINEAGSIARLLLTSDELGMALDVELSRARHGELELRTDETVYVSPRAARVFVPEDYSI